MDAGEGVETDRGGRGRSGYVRVRYRGRAELITALTNAAKEITRDLKLDEAKSRQILRELKIRIASRDSMVAYLDQTNWDDPEMSPLCDQLIDLLKDEPKR